MRHRRGYSLPAGMGSLKKSGRFILIMRTKLELIPCNWFIIVFSHLLYFFFLFLFIIILSSFIICFRDWQNKQCWKIKFMWLLLTMLKLQLHFFTKKKKSLLFNLLEVQLICVDLFSFFDKYRKIQYYFLEILKTFFFAVYIPYEGLRGAFYAWTVTRKKRQKITTNDLWVHRDHNFSEISASSQLQESKNQHEPRSKFIFPLVKMKQNDTG